LLLLLKSATIAVGAKGFTESRILAEIMAQAIERGTGLRVDRRDLGSTSLCVDALAGGAIDVYAEYSGTLLTDVFRQEPIADPKASWTRVQQLVLIDGRFALHEPFGFNDTYVLAMRADTARELAITGIGDLARHPGLRLGFTSEFNQRPDGWPGLARHYGLTGSAPVDLAPGHMYAAVRDGQVQVISAFSTDARIRRFGLVTLADDRRFFPAYEAAPLLRAASPHRTAIVQALAPLAGSLDDEAMAALNAAVDLDGRPIAEVAAAFLADRLKP
jgi:glycine betaine/choline ABC-type transport system substrate-binding protein